MRNVRHHAGRGCLRADRDHRRSAAGFQLLGTGRAGSKLRNHICHILLGRGLTPRHDLAQRRLPRWAKPLRLAISMEYPVSDFHRPSRGRDEKARPLAAAHCVVVVSGSRILQKKSWY